MAMLDDAYAVVSWGTYPDPDSTTTTQRAAYAVSYGLLGSVPTQEIGETLLGGMMIPLNLGIYLIRI